MATLHTDAVVVRLVDYGDADRIVTLFTRGAGKLTALARRARASRRRFGGALELFGRGEASLKRGRGELWTLESLHAARGFPGLAVDMTRVAHGAYVCELARELVPPEAPDEGVFRLLTDALAAIERDGGDATELRRFELALLERIGLQPALDRCVGCGVPPDDGAAHQGLDARRGGLLCAACGGGRAAPLPGAVRRGLVALQERGDDAPWRALGPPERAAAREAIQAVLREHLGRPLRSVEFIAKLNAASNV